MLNNLISRLWREKQIQKQVLTPTITAGRDMLITFKFYNELEILLPDTKSQYGFQFASNCRI